MGVNALRCLVENKLNWIFREQFADDFGIDAQIEIVDQGAVTGQLIAIQVKSGESFFRSETQDGWWFRPDQKHIDYWLRYSLPVVVVLYHPDYRKLYWQTIASETVQAGPRGGKRILIPMKQELTDISFGKMAEVAMSSTPEARLGRLRLALPWMQLLHEGRRIVIEADEWRNKMSGRSSLALYSDDDGRREQLGSWGIVAGLRKYSKVLQEILPWASLSNHEETYLQAAEEAWLDECTFYDNEGDFIVRESFDEWLSHSGRLNELRPYANSADEIDHWRLELELNDLGRAFLLLNNYLESKNTILVP